MKFNFATNSPNETAVPPHAPDVERTVLGSMLIDGHAAAAVFDLLDENAFYAGGNRKIFLCMKEIFAQGIPIDIITLTDTLRKKDWLECIGEEPYLAELAESIGTSANIGYYCRQLQEKTALREFISLGLEAQKADASPKLLFEKVKSNANRFKMHREGYDLSRWSLSRFSGEPEAAKFLVTDLIPKGIAGTLYSAGGTGKSTLALDLSLRVAIAGTIPTTWLGKYPVEPSGPILYLSAEEPEDILHRRIKGLSDAIGAETGMSGGELQEIAAPNLFMFNCWGKPQQLFEIKNNAITQTNEYKRILETLIKHKIGLLVIDTRSRLSGAEGAGNAIVAQEVAFYEQWAAQSGATVLILHHTNKASYDGLSHAQAAQRGESAFNDCLRFGLYLQPMSEASASNNGIPDDERKNYLTVTHAKSNYTRIQEPLILHRIGWSFNLTDFKPKPVREELQARQDEEDLAKTIQAIREDPGISQRGLIEKLKGSLSQQRILKSLKNPVASEYILSTPGERGAFRYTLHKPAAPP
jgi:RecA-family ATPase